MNLALGPGPDIMKSFPEIPCLTPLCFSLFYLLFQSSMHASVPCETGLGWSTNILNTLSILRRLAHLQMAPLLLMLYLELQPTALPWQLASSFKHASSRLVFQIPFHPNPCNQHCWNSSVSCLRLKQKNLGNRCLYHCFFTDTLSTFCVGCIVVTHTFSSS